ncbi:MAG: arginase family protein [Bradymonadales bacterium]|nr:arginase family protein [Bradymonadales bacterium]
MPDPEHQQPTHSEGSHHRKVTILNFEPSWSERLRCLSDEAEVIRLEDVPGCRRASEPQTLDLLRERLCRRTTGSVVFLGSGDYHHITRLLLERIDTPFSLLLFDNHPELLPPPFFGQLLGCGSWLSSAVDDLPHLMQVALVGTAFESLMEVEPARLARILYLPVDPIDHHLAACPRDAQKALTVLGAIRPQGIDKAIGDLLDRLPPGAIYISVDKDVLAADQVTTTWSQGQMTTAELVAAVTLLVSRRPLAGMDICGDLSCGPLDLLDPAQREAIDRHMEVNRALLEAVRVR